MVPVLELMWPILLAAVIVFVASSLVHMVFTYHRSDYDKLPNEDGVLAALRPFPMPPGDYTIPHAGSPEAMKDPAYLAKWQAGPVVFMTVLPNGTPSMGASLAQWFGYCVLVGLFTAYVTGRALGPGAYYLDVFQIAGTVAFMGYGFALFQFSIWYKRKWSTTLKSVADAFVYGLLTAGAFGWLWP